MGDGVKTPCERKGGRGKEASGPVNSCVTGRERKGAAGKGCQDSGLSKSFSR